MQAHPVRRRILLHKVLPREAAMTPLPERSLLEDYKATCHLPGRSSCAIALLYGAKGGHLSSSDQFALPQKHGRSRPVLERSWSAWQRKALLRIADPLRPPGPALDAIGTALAQDPVLAPRKRRGKPKRELGDKKLVSASPRRSHWAPRGATRRLHYLDLGQGFAATMHNFGYVVWVCESGNAPQGSSLPIHVAAALTVREAANLVLPLH